MPRIYSELKRSNIIIHVIDVSLHEQLKTTNIHGELVLLRDRIIINPSALTFFLREFIHFETLDFLLCFHNGNKLRKRILMNIFSFFLELPEADLLLTGCQHPIVVIIKSHLSIAIGAEFHHESLRWKVIFVNLLSNSKINHIVERDFRTHLHNLYYASLIQIKLIFIGLQFH